MRTVDLDLLNEQINVISGVRHDTDTFMFPVTANGLEGVLNLLGAIYDDVVGAGSCTIEKA